MPSTLSKSLQRENWGRVPYQAAFEKQAVYVEEIVSGLRPETVIFCSHPPVVTLGRGTQDGDVFSWDGEIVSVNRGGRATYHGPSQVVMYPLMRLDGGIPKSLAPKDLHGFMRVLEESLITVLKHYGIQALGHDAQPNILGDAKEATGVWFQGQKLASIGIAVRKWVSSHGLALNLYKDEKAFQGINPCGFSPKTMKSVEEILGKSIPRESFEDLLFASFSRKICL